jgi:hypothetical protein
MERALGAAYKTIIDTGAQSGSGVVPYLPLCLSRERQPSQSGAINKPCFASSQKITGSKHHISS